jgi:hypothetical protein
MRRWYLPPPSGPREVRVVSIPVRSGRPRCPICGREKLSREDYAWRRKNGLAVWHCQHRRPSPTHRREVLEAGGVIAVLVVCICLLA